MTEKELKVMTVNNMYGNWIGNDEKYQVDISITRENVVVKVMDKEKNETEINTLASSDFWWVEQFLNFFDCKQRFYILWATESEMLFGESKTPGNFDGKNKWLIKFNRN